VLGTQYSSGILLVAFLREWPEADASSAAWVASAPVAMMLLMSRFAGPLTARLGHRTVCIIGAILGASGLALTAVTTALWQAALTMGIIAGAGMSFGFVPSVLIVPLWFKKRRALALGLAVAGSGVGTFAVAPAIEAMIAAVGWRSALLWLALAMAACLLLASSVYRLPPAGEGDETAADDKAASSLESRSASRAALNAPGTPGGAADTEGADASPALDGEDGSPPKAAADGKAAPAKPAAAGPAASTGADKPTTAWGLATLPHFLPLIAATVIATGGYNGVFAHLVNSAVVAGVSPADAALTISVLGVLSTVGRVVAGRVSDMRVFPPHYMWYGSLIVAGAATMLVPVLETTTGGRVAYGAVFGLCAGNFIALMPVATADAVGMDLLPLGMGVMYSIQTLPVLAGPPAAGAIKVATGSYWPAWLFMGGLMLAGGLLVFLHKAPPHAAEEADADTPEAGAGKGEAEAGVEVELSKAGASV